MSTSSASSTTSVTPQVPSKVSWSASSEFKTLLNQARKVVIRQQQKTKHHSSLISHCIENIENTTTTTTTPIKEVSEDNEVNKDDSRLLFSIHNNVHTSVPSDYSKFYQIHHNGFGWVGLVVDEHTDRWKPNSRLHTLLKEIIISKSQPQPTTQSRLVVVNLANQNHTMIIPIYTFYCSYEPSKQRQTRVLCFNEHHLVTITECRNHRHSNLPGKKRFECKTHLEIYTINEQKNYNHYYLTSLDSIPITKTAKRPMVIGNQAQFIHVTRYIHPNQIKSTILFDLRSKVVKEYKMNKGCQFSTLLTHFIPAIHFVIRDDLWFVYNAYNKSSIEIFRLTIRPHEDFAVLTSLHKIEYVNQFMTNNSSLSLYMLYDYNDDDSSKEKCTSQLLTTHYSTHYSVYDPRIEEFQGYITLWSIPHHLSITNVHSFLSTTTTNGLVSQKVDMSEYNRYIQTIGKNTTIKGSPQIGFINRSTIYVMTELCYNGTTTSHFNFSRLKIIDQRATFDGSALSIPIDEDSIGVHIIEPSGKFLKQVLQSLEEGISRVIINVPHSILLMILMYFIEML